MKNFIAVDFTTICDRCEYGDDGRIKRYCLEHNPLVSTAFDGTLVVHQPTVHGGKTHTSVIQKGGKYYDWDMMDMQSAIKARLLHRPAHKSTCSPTAGADMLPPKGSKPPSYKYLEALYHVPSSSIQDRVNIAIENKWRWNDPNLVMQGRPEVAIVPKPLRDSFAGYIMLCDSAAVREQLTQAEAGICLIEYLDVAKVNYPARWLEESGPSSEWWAKYLAQYPCISLVRVAIRTSTVLLPYLTAPRRAGQV